MYRRHLNKLLPLLASSLILLATAGVADETRMVLSDQQGFCISLRDVDRENLSRDIQQSRSRLARHQSRLSERVESLKFGKLDALITLVMPGGLIYAAIKKESERQEARRLEGVTQELAQLNSDLLALQLDGAGKTLALK